MSSRLTSPSILFGAGIEQGADHDQQQDQRIISPEHAGNLKHRRDPPGAVTGRQARQRAACSIGLGCDLAEDPLGVILSVTFFLMFFTMAAIDPNGNIITFARG